MAIRTLVIGKIKSFDIQIERSDSGKVFFGIKRAKPKMNNYYTFDMKDNPGCLLEIVRNGIATTPSGERESLDVMIGINPSAKAIAYHSRTHPVSSRSWSEIWRAYKMVEMCRNKLEPVSVSPELEGILEVIVNQDPADYKKDYSLSSY